MDWDPFEALAPATRPVDRTLPPVAVETAWGEPPGFLPDPDTDAVEMPGPPIPFAHKEFPMRPLLLAIALVVTDGSAALGQTLPLKPDLAGVSFLVGTWRSDDGKVAETNGTSRGRSTITAEAGGSVLLRRDHTELFGADGKPSGSFDQIMMIYPEAGTLRAEYADGDHHITYVTATVVPGHSVQFTSATAVDAPTFRLSYELTAPGDLAVRFEAAPPGKASFAPIASGTLHRER